MSRYRTPFPVSSPYITPKGEARLRKELEYLWRVERPDVTRSVTAAAAQGDRSENAEYTYGKKRLREIDRRVRYLRKRLEVLKVVNTLPTDRKKAWFGAWVKVMDENWIETQYRLVGADEIDPQHNHISIDSIMGRNLLGKSVDSDFTIETPSGSKEFVLTAVWYEQEQPL